MLSTEDNEKSPAIAFAAWIVEDALEGYHAGEYPKGSALLNRQAVFLVSVSASLQV